MRLAVLCVNKEKYSPRLLDFKTKVYMRLMEGCNAVQGLRTTTSQQRFLGLIQSLPSSTLELADL